MAGMGVGLLLSALIRGAVFQNVEGVQAASNSSKFMAASAVDESRRASRNCSNFAKLARFNVNDEVMSFMCVLSGCIFLLQQKQLSPGDAFFIYCFPFRPRTAPNHECPI
jgi:hypothetical protein